MSADNGVYILETRGQRRGEKVYRVVHAQAIENIEWEPDYPAREPRLNRKYTLMYFGEAVAWTNLDHALEYAKELHDEIADEGIVEYGICFLDHSCVHFPSTKKLRKRQARRLKRILARSR